jgi:putative peptidoglycan lipid II flippase
MLVLIAVGTAAYGLFGQGLGAFRLQEIQTRLRR